MSRRTARLCLLAALTACASSKDAGFDTGFSTGFDVEAVDALRLDVYPSGATSLLPQSFTVTRTETESIAFELAPTVEVTGTITGTLPSPIDITVPGEDAAAVVARVSLSIPGTIASAATTSSADGAYDLLVPASATGYRLVAVAEDPVQLPLFVEDGLSITAPTTLDADLGLGAAVWGHVLQSDGTPIPSGATVRLVDETTGEAGPSATLESDGGWLLRALPGRYTLQVRGEGASVVPTLTDTLRITEDDLTRMVDFDAGFIDTGRVAGVITDSSGVPIDDAEVRFTAIQLPDVIEGATAEVSTDTDRNGLFARELVRGTWLMEVIPSYARTIESSPTSAIIEVDGPDVNLGSTALPDRLKVQATVTETGGNATGIVITAQERGFDHYTYTATTDASGDFRLDLPDVPLELTIQPPDGERPVTRLLVDRPAALAQVPLETEGSRLGGRLTQPGGAGLAFALVEVRGAGGALLGTTLTDGSGDFTLTVGVLDEELTDTGG